MDSKWVRSVKMKFMEYGFWRGTYGAEITLSKEPSLDYASDMTDITIKVKEAKLPTTPLFARISGFDPKCAEVQLLAGGLYALGFVVQILIPFEDGAQIPTWISSAKDFWITAVAKKSSMIFPSIREIWYYPDKEAPVIPHIVTIPVNPAPQWFYIAQEGSVERMLKFLREDPHPWRTL